MNRSWIVLAALAAGFVLLLAGQGAAHHTENSRTAVVIVRTGSPDALVGAAVAGAHDAPVFYVDHRARIPDETRGALRLRRPGICYIIGGTTAVTPVHERQIRSASGCLVSRYSGKTRHGTAADVANWLFPY